MYLLNVFNMYVQELENQCIEMVGNYTLNVQFCILGSSDGLLAVIHHRRSHLVQAKRTFHLCDYNCC